MYKSLIILPILTLAMQGCGGGKSTGGSETITAPVISGSTWSGLAFGAVNRDRNIKTSRIYYYDFKAGEINETLSGESGSPGLFYKDSKLFVVNRDSGNQNIKIIDDIKAETVVPSFVDLEGLTAGDPWSLETVFPGKTVLLGAPETGKLFTLDYKEGDLTEVDLSKLKNTPLRAVAMQRTGSVINIVHSGVERIAADSYAADATQAVYRLKVDTNGGVSFTDEDASTTAVDGRAIKSTNPVLAGSDGTTLTIVGLCNNIISGCVPAIESFSSGSITTLNDFATAATFKYQLINQIIAGPSSNEVYAHVSTPAGEYKLILLNISTLAVTDVHTFSDYNLYGFNYDRGSKTLFIGEAGDLSGSLYVYNNQILSEKIDISGVLSTSAFIP